MPDIESFDTAEDYYATLGHECTHWTRHKTRLDRAFGRERFGDEGYAQEELVAELGAAFLCADLGLHSRTGRPCGLYRFRLKVLKNDKRAIFTAAAHAQRAADFRTASSRFSQRPDVCEPLPVGFAGQSVHRIPPLLFHVCPQA